MDYTSGMHFCLIYFSYQHFLFFSLYIRKDPFYYSQYPHLFSIFIYIHIVGVVLENRRRTNFLQFNDLTEQKRLVEELNHQKNKVISILSHDVATPLNSLSAILYLQARGDMDETELKPYLQKLREEFDNVSFLLHSLVRWSRSQMQGFVLDKTTVDLVELLERKIKLFQLQLLDKDLDLKLEAEGPTYIKADEEMIRIALRNLISNAIKFARNGSSIQLEVSKRDEHKVKVIVANQGDPIPSDLKEKLFTYQMPSTLDTRGERGTGLGLAMTAFFVRLNGGEVYLAPTTNEEDGVTSFCLELPQGVDYSITA